MLFDIPVSLLILNKLKSKYSCIDRRNSQRKAELPGYRGITGFPSRLLSGHFYFCGSATFGKGKWLFCLKNENQQ